MNKYVLMMAAVGLIAAAPAYYAFQAQAEEAAAPAMEAPATEAAAPAVDCANIPEGTEAPAECAAAAPAAGEAAAPAEHAPAEGAAH